MSSLVSPVPYEGVVIAQSSGWDATSIAAWVALVLVIILIIIIIFYVFLSSSVNTTGELFAANYQYAINVGAQSGQVPTSSNYIYIIPSGTPSGSEVFINSNTKNLPGRTFLIKNDSSFPVFIKPAAGVKLYNIAGDLAGPDESVDELSLAIYITNNINPNTEFRRLQ